MAIGYTSRIRYVAKTGSDANNGLSWDTAKLTIQAAVNSTDDAGSAAGGAAAVEVAAGIYEETVQITKARVILRGVAPGYAGDSRGAIIRAPSAGADCIQVLGSEYGGDAQFVQIDNIGTEGHDSALWTGRGIYVAGAYATRVTNWMHRALRDPTETYGGDGIYLLNTEACSVETASISHANIAVHCGHDFSTSTFQNITSSGCFRILYEEAVPGFASGGGHVFIKWKSVAGILNPTDFGSYSVWQQENTDGAQPGNNIYMACDFSEDYGLETTCRWEGRRNRFIQCVIAPQSTWQIAGFSSVVETISVLGALELEGAGHFVNGIFADSYPTVTGTNHVFGPCHGNEGTLFFPVLPSGNFRLALVPSDGYQPAYAAWHDDPNHTTPITAAALDTIEGGISTLYDDGPFSP